MEFLGFILNSREVSITITLKKEEMIIKLCEAVFSTTPTRLVARLIGNMTVTEEAFPLAPLHYRPIDMEKAQAVEFNCGNYDATMVLGNTAIAEIQWWKSNIMEIKSWIHCPPDTSRHGWGAESDGNKTNGRWSEDEIEINGDLSINHLEILAVKFAILSFVRQTCHDTYV